MKRTSATRRLPLRRGRLSRTSASGAATACRRWARTSCSTRPFVRSASGLVVQKTESQSDGDPAGVARQASLRLRCRRGGRSARVRRHAFQSCFCSTAASSMRSASTSLGAHSTSCLPKRRTTRRSSESYFSARSAGPRRTQRSARSSRTFEAAPLSAREPQTRRPRSDAEKKPEERRKAGKDPFSHLAGTPSRDPRRRAFEDVLVALVDSGRNLNH